jgi:hypothetical protein
LPTDNELLLDIRDILKDCRSELRTIRRITAIGLPSDGMLGGEAGAAKRL